MKLPKVSQVIRVAGDRVTLELTEGPLELPIIPLADELLEWIQEGRRDLYDGLLDAGESGVRFFAQHLPAVVTYNQDGVFPFNCGNKGVGFVPAFEHLEEVIARYRSTHETTQGTPWEETLRRRVRTVKAFNLDTDLIDRRCFITLEIFRKGTYRNLRRMPLASLLYTGDSPRFLSYQVNCAVEIIGSDDPRHTFATLARTMFEFEDFHITQHRFPYAYVFWISECISKTPFRTVNNEELIQSAAPAELELPWDEDTLAAVGRAPAMIQNRIRALIEVFAQQRGFVRVTSGVVEEAKKNLMDGR